MDIGDPSDFPATRRRLPSMRELGAFDAEGKLAAPAPPASETLLRSRPVTPDTADATPASERAGPSAAQLRRAMARADPGTRRRLVRLFGKRDAQKAMASDGASPLLRLDEQTGLLCATPIASEEPGGVVPRARVDRPSSETAAIDIPRVLFPAYDPAEHGPDLRTPLRPAAPVEGHFPPPRQPFAAPAQQVHERTPKAEPTGQSAAVVAPTTAPAAAPATAVATATIPAAPSRTEPGADRQSNLLFQPEEPRARDGVNGLLLSRRDLDEAVEDGLLPADAAALLWKNWSARRPVIHVIDDPLPPPAPSGSAAAEVNDEAGDLPPGSPAQPGDDLLPAPTQHSPSPESPPAAGMQAPLTAATPTPVAEVRSAADLPAAAPPAAADPPDTTSGARPHAAPVMPTPRDVVSERRSRAAWLVRHAWQVLLAVCVLSTAARLGQWAWPHARPWLGG